MVPVGIQLEKLPARSSFGVCFILYLTNVFQPSLIGIALMFGIGNAFDSVVSLFTFAYLLKKEKINIFKAV